MDGAFRDIRATQVDMTQLPEQDASSDVTKFESWRGHRISWAYGIETKGSESLGVRYSGKLSESRISACDILLPILPVKDNQLNIASLILSARTLSIRRSLPFLRHFLMVAPLLSFNGNFGKPIILRLLVSCGLMVFIMPTISVDELKYAHPKKVGRVCG